MVNITFKDCNHLSPMITILESSFMEANSKVGTASDKQK